MQFTQGNLYWKKVNNIKNMYPYLHKDTSCDVLVIGGGITGALTTYFLAKEGFDVIVAEKNIVGYGNTIASSASLEYQIDVDLNRLAKIIGEQKAAKIYKMCENAIDEIEKIDKEIGKKGEFKRKDALYYTNKFTHKQNMLKEHEMRKKHGFKTSYLDSHNTLNLTSGILTKNGSATINPYMFTQELFEYLSEFENVRIYENTNIEDIIFNSASLKCITNNNFNISAKKVIFATGYETLKYIKNSPAQVYRTFAIITKPLEELKKLDTNFTARDTTYPFHYIRFLDDNRIMYSGEDIKLTDKMLNDSYLLHFSNDRYRRLHSSLFKTFNKIDDIPIEYAFNANYAITKDTLPIIDEIESMPNCFCNLGFGTNGILYSQIGASMLKDAVKGYFTKDMNLFRIER